MAGATVSITRDFPDLSQLELTTKADMREIGLLARERIVRRTRQGMGPDGPLAPLSPEYAARKRDALGTDAPDLTVSGNMLNHLDLVDVQDDSVTLGWNQ